MLAAATIFAGCTDDIEINTVGEQSFDTRQSYLSIRNDDIPRQIIGVELNDFTCTRQVRLALTKTIDNDQQAVIEIDPQAVEEYNKANFTSYDVFPAAQASIAGNGTVQIGKWLDRSAPVDVTIDKGTLTPGSKYMLALSIKEGSTSGDVKLAPQKSTIYWLVTVGNPVPDNTKPYKTLCYVEVNRESILNVGAYTLATSGKQLFDIAVIFAANINWNYDEQRPYLKFNENVQHILSHRDKYVKPLQDKGIKVILDVLGNHDFTGVGCLGGKYAVDFADECRSAVEAYGLDGVDLDDEWSSYNPTSPVGGASGQKMGELILALRKAMPDKIVAVYNIGASISVPNIINGEAVADAVDISTYPYYGSFGTNPPFGLPKSKYAPIGVNVSTQLPYSLTYYTQTYNVNQGFGCFFVYDLTSVDRTSYLTQASNVLFGEATVLSQPLVSKDF